MTSKDASEGRSPIRQVLTAAALLAALIVLIAMIRTRVTTDLAIQDFVQYWAAARLNLQGLDPYDAGAMLALERPLGWTEAEPNFMYNPPWLLALATPFAYFDYATARTACMVLQFLHHRGPGRGPLGRSWRAGPAPMGRRPAGDARLSVLDHAPAWPVELDPAGGLCRISPLGGSRPRFPGGLGPGPGDGQAAPGLSDLAGRGDLGDPPSTMGASSPAARRCSGS